MRARLACLLALCAIAAGCGGATAPPGRRVIEGPVGGWNFRRYQKLVDVEVWVSADNPAVAHTASYARDQAERERGRLAEHDVASAFVTEYKTPAGVLRALVAFARRLAQDSGYKVDEASVGGVRVLTVTGQGESWALWGSGRFVVKVGGPGLAAAPPSLVEAYGKPYPSKLPAGALEGDLPPGPEQAPPRARPAPRDPADPQPDWEAGKRRKGGDR